MDLKNTILKYIY